MSNTSKNRAVQALLLTAWIAIILVSQTTTPVNSQAFRTVEVLGCSASVQLGELQFSE